MKNNLLLLALTFLVSHSSQARSGGDWQDVGNGGDVVLCPSFAPNDFAGSYEYYSLDYIESVHRWHIYPDLPGGISEPIKLAMQILDRLPRGYGFLKANAQLHLLAMSKESVLIDGPLPDASDEGFTMTPNECFMLQLALQKPAKSGAPYYRFNKALWELLSVEQKAVVMVHEVLYRLSTKAISAYSSERIRYVVALLLANLFQYDDGTSENKDLKEAGFFKE